MPGRCFVPGCPSGRTPGYKSHLFSTPKDPEEFKKWREACKQIRNMESVFTPHNIRWKDKVLMKSSKICHRHFLQEDIKKDFCISLSDGAVHSVPLLNWRVLPHKVPSIFNNITDPEDDTPPPRASTGFSGILEHSYSRPFSELGLPDVQECHTVAGTNKVAENKMATGPAIMPSTESESVTAIKLTGTNQPNQPYRFTLLAPTKDEQDIKKILKWKKRASTLQTLYQRWKTRYHRLDKKFQKYKIKRAEVKGPPREGVWVPYSNLNPREKMYADALAKKGNTKNLKSMRYTKTHILDSLITSCMGKKKYELLRKNGIQVMPSFRTLQKLKAGIANSKEGSSTDVVGYIKESLKDLEEEDQFVAIKFDEALLNGAFNRQGAQGNVKGSTSSNRKATKKKAPKQSNGNANTITATKLLCSV